MSKTIKKLVAVGAMLSMFTGAGVALAAAPNWDVGGSWVVAFDYLGTPYAHDMTLAQSGAGNLTGSGGHPAGGSHVYTWVLTSGSVSGDTIDFLADYTASADAVTPQTTMHVVGTIAPDGSMSGTWSDNYQGGVRTGTWTTTSGVATPIVVAPTVPTNKNQCKKGGWQTLARADASTFKNQGDCIQYVNTGK